MQNSRGFVLMTDSTTDLPLSFLKENEIRFVSLSYVLGENTYKDDLGEKTDLKEFYEKMRCGQMPSTTQINVADYMEGFTPFLEEGLDIIYIGFSSNLSGSFNSSTIAASELLEKYPQRKIACIDSLCASMGEGLLVYLAVEKLKEGAGFDELVSFAENTKQRINHWFTVDDLNHLFRGGRVSRAAAILGTLMSIKPVLNVDENGKLIPREKIRGRKQALDTLVNKLEKYGTNIKDQTIFISHGDSYEDAKYVGDSVKERFQVQNVIINFVGPVIGAHSGPGTIALFFLGKDRSL